MYADFRHKEPAIVKHDKKVLAARSKAPVDVAVGATAGE
jgi:hypothetical protein